MTDTPLVTVKTEAGVATVTMNRPPVNAIAPDLLHELGTALTGVGDDAQVRVVVLRSAIPRYWMAGADLGVLAAGGMVPEGSSLEETWRKLTAPYDILERLPKPTIAAIDGHALGGGCEMALCCDYRIMVDDGKSTIGLTETTLGILPGAGGTQRLPRLVGMGTARRLIIEGTRLRATDALALGLVDAALPPEGFEAMVGDKAQQLSTLATRSVGLAKRAVLDGYDKPLAEGLRIEAENFVASLQTDDAREGLSAFLEKRPAQFKGE